MPINSWPTSRGSQPLSTIYHPRGYMPYQLFFTIGTLDTKDISSINSYDQEDI